MRKDEKEQKKEPRHEMTRVRMEGRKGAVLVPGPQKGAAEAFRAVPIGGGLGDTVQFN